MSDNKKEEFIYRINDRKFETDRTENIVCPYCGNEDDCSWDYDFHDEKLEIWCSECDRAITVYRNVTVTYTTRKEHEKDLEADDLDGSVERNRLRNDGQK